MLQIGFYFFTPFPHVNVPLHPLPRQIFYMAKALVVSMLTARSWDGTAPSALAIAIEVSHCGLSLGTDLSEMRSGLQLQHRSPGPTLLRPGHPLQGADRHQLTEIDSY